MSRFGKSWQQWEDEIILAHISNGATNLTASFEKASQELGDRTPLACSARYYSELKHKYAKFEISDETGSHTNTKNEIRNKGHERSKISQILNISFNSLSKQEKLAFLSNKLQEIAN